MSSSLFSGAVLMLKRKALECKKSGDIEAAKTLLREARSIESLNPDDDPADLRKLAAVLKQHGDINGAKEALTQAKKLEQAKADSKSVEKKYEDPVNKAIDEANLDEITSTGGRGPSRVVAFTDDEMLDVETMADMKGAGMDIPTQQDYQARVYACKRAAIQAKKQGDIPSAKKHLLRSKQLEKAIVTLYNSGKGGEAGDEDDDDGEDYSLLDELMGDGGDGKNNKVQEDDGFFEQLFGKSSTVVELDDLDDLEPAMLRDMMESGMEIPDVDDVLASAKEQKAAAIKFKQSGDLVAAKAALEEAKRLEHGAAQLSDMLRAIESGACDESQNVDPEAFLEAMLEKEDGDKTDLKSKVDAQSTTAGTTVAAPEKLKTSDEYKIEAVRLKKEGNMPGAIAVLRLYKKALAAEASAKVAQQRKECLKNLLTEAEFANRQCRFFCFYERFVDKVHGQLQRAAWREYAQQCTRAVTKIKTGNKEPLPTLARSATTTLKQIREQDFAFIGSTFDPAEEKIEVSVLECFGLQTNKHLHEIYGVAKDDTEADFELPPADTIRVQATSQLPANMEYPDDKVELVVDAPISQVDGSSYIFQWSHILNAERGSSRFAKLLTRRLVRKRILFDVFYTTVKKGLFSRSSEQTLLGTAVVELKDLLQTNVIAGDFPLLDATRRHNLGGFLRIAIRTGSPFTTTALDQSKKANTDENEPMTARTGLTSSPANVKPYAPFILSD